MVCARFECGISKQLNSSFVIHFHMMSVMYHVHEWTTNGCWFIFANTPDITRVNSLIVAKALNDLLVWSNLGSNVLLSLLLQFLQSHTHLVPISYTLNNYTYHCSFNNNQLLLDVTSNAIVAPTVSTVSNLKLISLQKVIINRNDSSH